MTRDQDGHCGPDPPVALAVGHGGAVVWAIVLQWVEQGGVNGEVSVQTPSSPLPQIGRWRFRE